MKFLKPIPGQLKHSEEMVEAFHVLEKAQWSDAELEKYKAEEAAMNRERKQQEGAREEGRVEVAKKMLAKGLDIETITSMTDLSIDQIKQLLKK